MDLVYLDLLEDPYWRVSALDAILAWSVQFQCAKESADEAGCKMRQLV